MESLEKFKIAIKTYVMRIRMKKMRMFFFSFLDEMVIH